MKSTIAGCVLLIGAGAGLGAAPQALETRRERSPGGPPRAIQETFIEAPLEYFPGGPAAFRVVVSDVESRRALRPIQGATVRITLRQPQIPSKDPEKDPADGKEVATILAASTDVTGTVARTVPFPVVPDGNYELVVQTASSAGKEINRTPVKVARIAKLLLVTDKPLYQPNQTIHLRALALYEFDRTPAAGRELELTIEDAKGNRVFKRTAKAGEFGESALDFRLADEVNEGSWRVRASLGEVTADKVVTVKRYVLPKFKVSIDGAREFYRPGDKVTGSIDVRYFHGKPVEGAAVTIVARDSSTTRFKGGSGRGISAPSTITGKTTAEGKFEFELPKKLTDYDARTLAQAFTPDDAVETRADLRLDVEVKDAAGNVESATRTWDIALAPFRIELAPESGSLAPGVENRVWAIATLPDGSPLAGVKVSLVVAEQKTVSGETDAAGVATLSLFADETLFPPPPPPENWEEEIEETERSLPVTLTATGPGGEKITRQEELLAGFSRGGLLLRADKAIYSGGDTARFEVLTSPSAKAHIAFLDLAKQGQILATRSIPLEKGRGTLELSLAPGLSGTLEAHAYVIAPDGTSIRDSKVLFAESSSDLKVTATPDRTRYRPGDVATLRFQVSGQDGRGVPAALAALIVDESVYAMQEVTPGTEKMHFSLAPDLLYLPSGTERGKQDLPELIQDPAPGSSRQRAAAILLAGVELDGPEHWTVNPTEARIKKERALFDQIGEGLVALLHMDPDAAVKDAATGRWGWAGDPIARLEESDWVETAELVDGFGRRVRVETLEELGIPASYDHCAAAATAGRMYWMYEAVSEYANRFPEEVAGNGHDLWSQDRWRVPTDVLTRMEKTRGYLHRSMYRDLWGNRFQVEITRKDLPEDRDVPNPMQLRRVRIFSLGPDGIRGTADDVTEATSTGVAFMEQVVDGGVLGALAGGIGLGDMIGVGGLGLRGTGSGGGGAAMGSSSIGIGGLMTIGRGSGSGSIGYGSGSGSGSLPGEAGVSRVRQHFPETLLWEPALLTDAKGAATVTVPMADSITKWRLSCTASSKAGGLGSCGAGLEVFQDFFVDLDVPVALTRGDEITVPVTVHNYLSVPQDVRLALKEDEWFEALDGTEQRLTLPANGVDVRRFRVRAKSVGWKKLEVAAYGKELSDAVRRDVEVVADGRMVEAMQSNRLETGEVSWEFTLPENAVPGASRAFVKLYPGAFSQVVEGLDGILRFPGGCMEQTGSSAYPNLLVLNYLRRSGQKKPEVRKKAQEYVDAGYQRLLTFQTPPGGFALWGAHDKPNVFLTAWGIQIMQDTAKVRDVDPRVVERAKAWLATRQLEDGSFPVEFAVHREIWGRMEGNFGMTAYVVWSLAEGDPDRNAVTEAMVRKATAYLKANIGAVKEPYLLALAGAAFASADPQSADTRSALDRLAKASVEGPSCDRSAVARCNDRTLYWSSTAPTMVFATGAAANVETTALAAYALHRGGAHAASVSEALTWVVKAKDGGGTWGSTQATILSLKALLAASDPTPGAGDTAFVEVMLNGVKAGDAKITPQNSDVLQSVDLRAGLKPGKNVVVIRTKGDSKDAKGDAKRLNSMYQTVARWWVPEEKAGGKNPPAADPFNLFVSYDRTELAAEETVIAKARVELTGSKPTFGVMVELGVPPGFVPDAAAFEALKAKGVLDKYTLGDRVITVYLNDMRPGKSVELQYGLKARFPMKAASPKSVAYEYYTPSRRTETQPIAFLVR